MQQIENCLDDKVIVSFNGRHQQDFVKWKDHIVFYVTWIIDNESQWLDPNIRHNECINICINTTHYPFEVC